MSSQICCVSNSLYRTRYNLLPLLSLYRTLDPFAQGATIPGGDDSPTTRDGSGHLVDLEGRRERI